MVIRNSIGRMMHCIAKRCANIGNERIKMAICNGLSVMSMLRYSRSALLPVHCPINLFCDVGQPGCSRFPKVVFGNLELNSQVPIVTP